MTKRTIPPSAKFAPCTLVFVTLLCSAAQAELRVSHRDAFEDPGVFKVMEGRACDSRPGDSRDFPWPPFEFDASVRIGPYVNFEAQSFALPDYADQAFVFLNGFQARYTSKDHHLGSVGAVAGPGEAAPSAGADRRLHIPKAPDSDGFAFFGVELADKGSDDAVEGCAYYTAVAWNSREIQAAIVDDVSFDRRTERSETIASTRWTYRLDGMTAVAAPTQYIMADGNFSDRHALQVAYRLLQDNPQSERKTVRAHALMKDNDASAPTILDADIVMIGGGGVSMIEEQFTLDPVSRTCSTFPFGGCIGPEPKPGFTEPQAETVTRTVANEADYIVPVLTAFDLQSDGDDDHIKHVGAWVNALAYSNGGKTVRYTVNTVMQDKGGNRFNQRSRVSLMAFKRRRLVDVPPIGPDDLPGLGEVSQ